MRKQIKIRHRVLAVLGASMVLAVAPLSTSGASLPTETTHTKSGCETIDRQQNWSVAKICRDLSDGSQAGTVGVSSPTEPSEQASSSGSYLENPFLWVSVALAGVAGAFSAIVRRHRPAALS